MKSDTERELIMGAQRYRFLYKDDKGYVYMCLTSFAWYRYDKPLPPEKVEG